MNIQNQSNLSKFTMYDDTLRMVKEQLEESEVQVSHKS